ncbi:MAG: phospho-N-acetylmuramoyl-pentapeptide-transferase [Ectothiorhodospiraceae bacterium]|nr:phospho-N-acetylmuramoyl-pentapeptide-transferase [Ectothiorhodospiraceae bacterium]
MLYYLLEYINEAFAPPGFEVFKFITFRAAAAAITALLMNWLVGAKLIRLLKRLQIGESAKVEAPKNHLAKAGTPTMGGLIIISSITIPMLLWGELHNTYVWLILVTTVSLAGVGFLDDYLKVVKKYPKGLIGGYKIVGQVLVGAMVGSVLYFSPEFAEVNSLTTVPFFKNLNFDYLWLYIPAVIFVITATSNAVNLSDGLDGLAVGTIVIAFLAIAVISYVSGRVDLSDYLNILYLPGSGELAIFSAAIVGAGLGFLWYNAYPAQVFMGDTGSLALGGALGATMILIKKELLLPILGGIFFAETVSVIIQRLYFKYTRMKHGQGRRVFKMAPIHHHFELEGWAEPKIVVRFYIIAVILAILSLATFKVR